MNKPPNPPKQANKQTKNIFFKKPELLETEQLEQITPRAALSTQPWWNSSSLLLSLNIPLAWDVSSFMGTLFGVEGNTASVFFSGSFTREGNLAWLPGQAEEMLPSSCASLLLFQGMSSVSTRNGTSSVEGKLKKSKGRCDLYLTVWPVTQGENRRLLK